MIVINPISLAAHVTNSQIQKLHDKGIEIRRDNNDFLPVLACCKTLSEVRRVERMNDATKLFNFFDGCLFSEPGESNVCLN